MNIKKVSVVMLIALAVIITGCRTSPILDVIDAPVSASGKQTLADMGKAIKRAGRQLGWSIREVKPGHMIGTLYNKSHMAKVDIKFTKSNYSITYKDSAALKYDGINIHNAYNQWVGNLDQRIRNELEVL